MKTTSKHGFKKPDYTDYCDIQVLNENWDKAEEALEEKANYTDITTPFNFKGSRTYSNLPSSGNTKNDTYYVTDRKCRYTWNGSYWAQSSMNETEYVDELNAMRAELDGLGLSVVDGAINITFEEV